MRRGEEKEREICIYITQAGPFRMCENRASDDRFSKPISRREAFASPGKSRSGPPLFSRQPGIKGTRGAREGWRISPVRFTYIDARSFARFIRMPGHPHDTALRGRLPSENRFERGARTRGPFDNAAAPVNGETSLCALWLLAPSIRRVPD